MSTKEYYGPKGNYLKEHKKYFSKKRLQTEVNFLINTLRLNKEDKILDLACGHGRHTIALKKLGFNIEGLDFSKHLIDEAEKQAQQSELQIPFHYQDIHNINLSKQYDKIFIMFSEFGLFNTDTVLKSINQILNRKGIFLLDSDNVFRLIAYLKKHPKSPYRFDHASMELSNTTNSEKIRYYTASELKEIIEKHSFKIKAVYGGYKQEELDTNSKRIIIVSEK
jgi:2-polyprenyl-3-methyl-5-hydroxy-6-metoxy-1,4-benzoquinol methylase